MKRSDGPTLRFPFIISLVCLLFTILLWDRFLESDRYYDRVIASHLILILGTLLSVMSGLFVWSLGHNLCQSEKARSFMDNVIQAMVAPLMIVAPGGTVKAVNRAALDLLGYREEELVEKPAACVFKDGFLTQEKIEALIRSDRVGQTERLYLTKSGKSIPVLFSAAVLRDPEGKVLGVVCVAQNLSEMKRLQKHVFQAGQMEAMGRLAAGIAHDFNNLLTVVAGYSEFLIADLASEDLKRDEAEKIHKLAIQGTNLTRQLLALSGRQIVRPKVIDLNKSVFNTLKLLRKFLRENIELVTLPSKESGRVIIDPAQVEQVLMNLIVNARDAMEHGGKLVIQVSNAYLNESAVEPYAKLRAGDYVMLSVRDTGCGMSEEVKAHIFEPYFTTKGREKGTGLGLATTYGIIKQAGGCITVTSEIDRGTTFEIYLPLVEKPEEVVSERERPEPRRLGTETILLVEDEALVRNFVARVLKDQHYDVMVASNGSEALRMIAEQPDKRVHLLLADMVMPQMGGRELVDRIRKVRPHLRVLLTSGYTENPFTDEQEWRADIALIPKPFLRDELISKVREVLDQP